jgi:hypothetical protein
MFCSTCGKSIQGNMNFCNACGTPTEAGPVTTDRRVAGLFVVGSIFVALFGLVGLFPLLKILLDSRMDPAGVGILILAYLVIWLAMFSLMLGLGWKLLGNSRPKSKKLEPNTEYRAPASFKGVNTSQLPAGDPGFGSVTDSTTRTLDEVLVDRK